MAIKMTINEYVIDCIRDYYENYGDTPDKINIDYARDMLEDINSDVFVEITDEYSPAIIKKVWNDKVNELKKAGFSILWCVKIRLYDDEWSQWIKESFKEPVRYDWSDSRGYKCIIEESAIDENNCVYFRVTSDSMRHCYEEWDGQLTDGAFENCDVASHEEVSNTVEDILY